MNRVSMVVLAAVIGVAGLVTYLVVSAPAAGDADGGSASSAAPSGDAVGGDEAARAATADALDEAPPVADDGELDPAAPSAETRAMRSAIEALGDEATYTPEIEARLVEALRFPDQDVRGHAAWSLGRMAPATRASVGALIAALGDRAWSVQHNAAWALARFDAAEVEGPLLAALDDASPIRRVRAAKALNVAAPSHGARVEATLLATWPDADDATRVIALGALGELEAPSDRVISHVGAVARTPDSGDLRGPAVNALAALGPRARAAALDLIGALGDERADIRRSAAFALGRLGETSAEVTAALVDALDDRKDAVGIGSAQALSALEAVDALEAAVRDGGPRARAHAVTGLGAAEGALDDRRVSLIVAALGDPAWPVRLAAASALANRDTPGAIDALAAALDDDHDAVRIKARATLEAMTLPAAKAALAKADRR